MLQNVHFSQKTWNLYPSHGNLAKVAMNEIKVDIVSMLYMATSDGVAEFFISNIPPYYFDGIRFI